jgi:hypothetical protein
MHCVHLVSRLRKRYLPKQRLHKTFILNAPLRSVFCFHNVEMSTNRTKVHIRENSWLAKRAAANLGFDYVAMVFGNTIHLHNTTKEKFFARPSWVLHELKHVEQYQRLGMFLFLCKYGIEHMKKGYWNNAFEVEAREAEGEYGLLSRYDLSDYSQYMIAGYNPG